MIYEYCVVFILLFVATLGKSLPLKLDSSPLLSRFKRSAECRCTCGRNMGAPDVIQPISDQSTPEDDTNWLTSAGLFEGDIMLKGTPEEEFSTLRNALPEKKWPNKTVYYILEGIETENKKRLIFEAFMHIQEKTCLEFISDYSNRQTDKVLIHQGDGCSSFVGRQGGQQRLSLGKGCYSVPGIVHELVHALGFYHEHSRIDRDNYVQIYKDNIISGKEGQFTPKWDGTLYGCYDLQSVMHYQRMTFSNGKGPTIVSIKNPDEELSNNDGLSSGDVNKINKFYDC